MRGVVVDAGPCPYLPGRRFHAFRPIDPVDTATYRILLEHRFRRSGGMFYMPHCDGCRACQPIRVAVASFRPRRDQRRCLARNADLSVTTAARGIDDERRALWHRYHAAVHDDPDHGEPDDFATVDAGIPGCELHARDATGRLLGVAICDLVEDVWSSVYCYWEPAAAQRGLGTLLALAEISTAARHGFTWWYPGFWVAVCSKMAYKARFGPAEVLADGGRWVPLDGSSRHDCG